MNEPLIFFPGHVAGSSHSLSFLNLLDGVDDRVEFCQVRQEGQGEVSIQIRDQGLSSAAST